MPFVNINTIDNKKMQTNKKNKYAHSNKFLIDEKI
jgi:hypothetical protein